MIKCKVFTGSDIKVVEWDINHFLKHKKDIKIISTLQSIDDDYTVVSIFYEEKK